MASGVATRIAVGGWPEVVLEAVRKLDDALADQAGEQQFCRLRRQLQELASPLGLNWPNTQDDLSSTAVGGRVPRRGGEQAMARRINSRQGLGDASIADLAVHWLQQSDWIQKAKLFSKSLPKSENRLDERNEHQELTRRCRENADLLEARINEGWRWSRVTPGARQSLELDEVLLKLLRAASHALSELPRRSGEHQLLSEAAHNFQQVLNVATWEEQDAICWPAPFLANAVEQNLLSELLARNLLHTADIPPEMECRDVAAVLWIVRSLVMNVPATASEWSELGVNLLCRILAPSMQSDNYSLLLDSLTGIFNKRSSWKIPAGPDWFGPFFVNLQQRLTQEIGDGEILPPIDAESRPCLSNLRAEDYEVVWHKDELTKTTGIKIFFGISGQQIPIVHVRPSVECEEAMQLWRRLPKLEETPCARQISIWQRDMELKLSEGRKVPTFRQVVQEFLESADGAEWFRQLAHLAQTVGDARGWLRNIKALGFNTFPEIDLRTGAVFAPLEHRQLPGAIGRETDQYEPGQVLHVERFSSNPSDCRFTFALAPDPRTYHLKCVLHKHAPMFPWLQEPLSRLLAQVTALDSKDPRLNPGIAGVFIEMADLLARNVSPNDRAKCGIADEILGTLSDSLRSFLPGVGLIPEAWRFSNPPQFREDEDVEVRFEFSDHVPCGRVMRVERFGLRGLEEPSRATIAVSAGPGYELYTQIIEQLREVGTEIARRLANELLRWPELRVRKGNDMEEPFAEFFRLLWPENHAANLRNDNLELFERIAKWFEQIVAGQGVFETRCPNPREFLLPNWRLGENYVAANSGQWVDPKRIERVVRPLLTFYGRGTVKEKAILYVIE